MIRSCLICGLVIGLAIDAAADAPNESEAVTIRLDKIRQGTSAFNHFRELEPEVFDLQPTPKEKEYYATPEGAAELLQKYKKSVLHQIDHAMMAMPEDAKAGPGFAVTGTDSEIRQGIYNVLVKGDKPVEQFPAGSEITVVFFARPRSQPAVRLDAVVRRGNTVEIRYMLISRAVQTLSVKSYFALVPLGELPVGIYRVEMIRLTENERQFGKPHYLPVEAGVEERLICKSFTFEVVEQP